MFNVSDKAAKEIDRLLKDEEMENAFLRIRVVPGGCSGFSYEMGFDDEIDESDHMKQTLKRHTTEENILAASYAA